MILCSVMKPVSKVGGKTALNGQRVAGSPGETFGDDNVIHEKSAANFCTPALF